LESFSDHIPAAGNLNVSTHRKENKMKVYDVVPGLEFDPERDFEQSPAWFLDGTQDTDVRLVLDKFLSTRHAVRGREIEPANRKRVGLAIYERRGLPDTASGEVGRGKTAQRRTISQSDFAFHTGL
jgi:hypothetical protein